MQRRIQSRKISRTENGRFGTSHSWPQYGVNLAHCIPLSDSALNSGHKTMSANTVGDKVWRIFTEDNALAQHFGCEVLHVLGQRWISIGCWHNFEQAHITHWIKEVRDQEVTPEILATTL